MRLKLFFLTMTLGFVSLWTQPLWALPATQAEVKVFVIKERVGHVSIEVHPDYYTVLLFSSAFTGAMELPEDDESPFNTTANGRYITLWVRADKPLKPGAASSMLFATEDFHLNLTARVTSDPEARLYGSPTRRTRTISIPRL
jgi:hypothetical protein